MAVMTRGFTKEIRNSVGSLLSKRAFSLVEEKEDPTHFGSALAVFQSPVLRLRFVRDRGGLLVDVAEAGSSEQWHKLEDVLVTCVPVFNRVGRFEAAAMQKLAEEYVNISRPISDIASLKGVLTKHLGTIEERFGPYQIELTRRLLDGIEHRESQATVNPMFAKSGSAGGKARSESSAP
jgi:hypothetical protein